MEIRFLLDPEMQHKQEVWLAQKRSEIASKIEEGYAAAERGELLDPDHVRSKLNELKRSSLYKTS